MQAPFPPTYQPDLGYRQYSKNYVKYLDLYSTFLRASRRICSGIPAGKCRRQGADVLRLCDLDDKYSPSRSGRLLSTTDATGRRDANIVSVRSSDAAIDSRDAQRNHQPVERGSPRGRPDLPGKRCKDSGIQPPDSEHTPPKLKPVESKLEAPLHAAIDCKVQPRADQILATGASKNDVMFMMIGCGIPPKTCKEYWEKYPILHSCDPSYVMLIICSYLGLKRDQRMYTDECIEKGLVKPAYVP